VGRAMLSVTGEVSVSLVVPGSRADLGPDRVLTVNDVPVFVAALLAASSAVASPSRRVRRAANQTLA